MAAWRGQISLPDGEVLNDIVLTPASATTSVPKHGLLPGVRGLRFLSLVDPSRIPLHLAAGPSLAVHTESAATEDWFAERLLCGAPDSLLSPSPLPEDMRTLQAPVGILVEAERGRKDAHAWPRVTEVLFYCTLECSPAEAAAQEALPTPPNAHNHQPADIAAATEGRKPPATPQFKVYALPLSSDLIYQSRAPTPPSSPSSSTTRNAEPPRFLPSQRDAAITAAERKRVSDVFEEATARKKSGKRVPEQSGSVERTTPSANVPPARKSLSLEPSRAGRASPTLPPPPSDAETGARPQQQPIPRSLSATPDAATRPASRRGLPETGSHKRSSLSKVTSVGATTEPAELTVEARNRDAISRIVMAGMRIYGWLPRKRNTRRGGGSTTHALPGDGAAASPLTEEQKAAESARDEEYKMIYHHAFKGTVFAFRNYIATQPLHTQPDRLRDTVDKLLAIFCVDPMPPAPGASGDGHTATSTPAHGGRALLDSGESPFDAIRGQSGTPKDALKTPTRASARHRTKTQPD